MTDQSLVLLSQAEKALAQANSIPDVVEIIDMAQAARVLANKARLGLAAENHAAVIKLRAQRKAGELLATMRATGQRSTGSGARESNATTLADLGVTNDQSSRWQKLAENFTDDDLQERSAAAIDHAVALTEADLYRELRRQQPATDPPPPPTMTDTLTGIFDLLARRLEPVSLADLADTDIDEEDRDRLLEALDPSLDTLKMIRSTLAPADITEPVWPDDPYQADFAATETALERAKELIDGPPHIVERAVALRAELEEGVGRARAVEIQGELDQMFVELNNIQPGDTVDHDDTGHTIEREPVDDGDHIDDGATVLCAFPGCTLDDEHDGDHICDVDETLTNYMKAPKDRGALEAKCCTRAEIAFARFPDTLAIIAIQQELYAGIEEDRAAQLLEQLDVWLNAPLTDYACDPINGTERSCRKLIATLDPTHPRVAEIQQQLYRGRVTVSEAGALGRELKKIRDQVPTKV